MRSRGAGARNRTGERTGGKGLLGEKTLSSSLSPLVGRTVSALNFRAPHDPVSPLPSEVRSQATRPRNIQVSLAPRNQQSTGPSLAARTGQKHTFFAGPHTSPKPGNPKL
jgi:hypothetical protein